MALRWRYSWWCERAQRWRCAKGRDGCHGIRAGWRRARDADDDVTLTLLSQRPMMFQDSEVELQDRVGALETAVDDAVDLGVPPECAKMLRDIDMRSHLDVFRRALLSDPPARVEPMSVRLRPGARAVHASVKLTEVLLAGSDKFPTKEVARGVQAAAEEGGPTLDTALGVAALDSEGLYWVAPHGHA